MNVFRAWGPCMYKKGVLLGWDAFGTCVSLSWITFRSLFLGYEVRGSSGCHLGCGRFGDNRLDCERMEGQEAC